MENPAERLVPARVRRRARMRWAVLGALVLALAGAELSSAPSPAQAAGPQAADARKAPLGTLLVKVSGVPRPRAVLVRIDRRGGPHRKARTGARLRLPAGTYRLRVAPVRVKGGRRYTPSKVMVFRVRPRKVTRARIRYSIRVPDSTRVVAARRIRAVSGSQVLMPAAAARRVRVGDVVAAGVGPETPTGLLVKVTARRRSGGQVVLQTRPATLPQAIPEGRFSIRVRPDGTISGAEVAGGGRAEPMAASVRISRDFTVFDQGDGAGLKGAGCSVGGGTSTRGTVRVEAGFSLSASWRLLRLQEVAFDSDFSVGADAQVSGSVSGSCRASFSTPSVPIGSPITFLVGPVPVVIVPKVSGEGSASVSAGFSGSAGVSGSYSLQAGVRIRNGRTETTHSANPSFSVRPPAASGLTGSAEVEVGPRLALRLYDVAGPELSASGFLRAGGDTAARPWWWVDGGARASLAARFSVLGAEAVAQVDILDLSRRLADSGTGAPPGPSQPPPAPSAPPRAADLDGLIVEFRGVRSNGQGSQCDPFRYPYESQFDRWYRAESVAPVMVRAPASAWRVSAAPTGQAHVFLSEDYYPSLGYSAFDVTSPSGPDYTVEIYGVVDDAVDPCRQALAVGQTVLLQRDVAAVTNDPAPAGPRPDDWPLPAPSAVVEGSCVSWIARRTSASTFDLRLEFDTGVQTDPSMNTCEPD